jgi:hypothetical protein
LGEGKPGEVKKAHFTLTNHGDLPGSFTVTGSCNCLKLEPKTGQLAPGEQREVHLEVKLKREGQDEPITLNVKMNADGQQQEEQVRFLARCPAPLSAKPATVDFGRLPQGQGAVAVLRLFDKAGQPWRQGALQVRSSQPHCQATLQQTAEGTELQVCLAPQAPAGHIGGEVVVSAPGTEISITIPLTGEVVQPVQFAPAALRFPGGSSRRLILMVWRGDGQPLGVLSPVALPAGVQVQFLSEPTVKRQRVAVTLADGAVVPAGAKLQLRSNSAEGTLLEVPLFAE